MVKLGGTRGGVQQVFRRVQKGCVSVSQMVKQFGELLEEHCM